MQLAEQIKAVVAGSGDENAKTESILKLLDAVKPVPTPAPANKAEGVAPVAPGVSAEDFRKMREELDLLKSKERLQLLSVKAQKTCEEAGIPKPAITQVFLETLINAPEDKWEQLVKDRKESVAPKPSGSPISAVAPDGKLTVESLTKALTGA